MSARQLKKLKGYDQTAELKKMMGVGSESEEEEAPRLSKSTLIKLIKILLQKF